MEITDNKFSITNKDRGKVLQWKYYFLDHGATLILYNAKDSLRLFKIK
jgi:hypothetical protein